MAVALPSFSGVAFRLRPPSSSGFSVDRFLSPNRNATVPFGISLLLRPSSRSVVVSARGKNRKGFAPSSSSSPKKKKKNNNNKKIFEGEDEEDDPFEALFNLLEEDLKNDKSTLDDDDKEISEEELDALAAQLAEALGGGEDDVDDGIDLFGSVTNDAVVVDDEDDGGGGEENDDEDDDDDEEEEEEDERPSKLKNWQLRRLAYALKAGRRKTSIKTLAAELCLERAYVLELLRDPPPKLLMLSATLPDEKPPVPAPDNSSRDPVPVEPSSRGEEIAETKPEEKVKDEAVHVMQQKWSSQKRVKKAHIETLEKVYRRSKRPTDAVVSSIIQVTNLPRKRVLKWFEDKRAEEGVPHKRAPYQAPV